MNRTLAISLGFALVVSCQAPPFIYAAERAEVLAAVHSITKNEAKGFIDTLADDSFEGREGGSRGGRAPSNASMIRPSAAPACDGAGTGGTVIVIL